MSAATQGPSAEQQINGSDGYSTTLTRSPEEIFISLKGPIGLSEKPRVFLALRKGTAIGSAVLPFQRETEGSTVFLPFKPDTLISAVAKDGSEVSERVWNNWKWSEPHNTRAVSVSAAGDILTFRIPRSYLGDAATIDCVVYVKDMSENDGWGRLVGGSDPDLTEGTGDKYISHYLEVAIKGPNTAKFTTIKSRLGNSDRIRIYQLFVRLFGNTNETRKPNGTLAENGVGKFADINKAALTSLKTAGFTHIWLTGVLQQATATDYSSIGQPADDPDLLKGLAGSPYAIKDYYDVCPDYAEDPAHRLDEFKALLTRIHEQKLKALIDLVPNHVARSYASDVQPNQDFGRKGNGGKGDDTSQFFAANNNFFYLTPDSSGPPVRLPTYKEGKPVSPTCKVLDEKQGTATSQSPKSPQSAAGKPPLLECDGLFEPEKEHGRVTGNNKASWTPDLGDWYETVKLNYGYDFTGQGKERRLYPNATAPDRSVPDTWQKMDSVIAYWQGMGVDGFRCDMSHMVPPEFWNWAIARARARHPEVVFIGEAYDNDPAKVPSVDPVISQLANGKSNVMFDLLNAGFNGVYDDPTYRAIKKIYEGPGWANDIDRARPDEFIFDNSLRYAENHDEARLASKSQWGGHGMQAGPAICAILYGLSRGPVLMYNGQEIGEPGAGIEGFGGDDSRTSIFDYWSMPELVKWVDNHKYDGGKLSDEQRKLRQTYGRILAVAGEPAFRDGIFIPLNAINRDNPKFGRVANEEPSGHWLYAFARYDRQSGQRFLVVVNLHPDTLMGEVRVKFSSETLSMLGLSAFPQRTHLDLRDRLVDDEPAVGGGSIAEAVGDGLPVDEMPALTPRYFELTLEPPK